MTEMSPEVDFLEHLSALDASLYEAAFGHYYKFRDLAHAKHVVTIYIKNKLVELYDKDSETEATIPFHTAGGSSRTTQAGKGVGDIGCARPRKDTISS